jgi:hypothetical protein
MKAKIVTAVIALTVTTIVPVYADGIQSPRGISQSAWNASSTYRNFNVLAEQVVVKVDMNYTTDRSDDYWFVNCEPIVIYTHQQTTFIQLITTDGKRYANSNGYTYDYGNKYRNYNGK